jgi:hypothetical protein
MKTKRIKIAKGERVEISVRRQEDRKTSVQADMCLVGPVSTDTQLRPYSLFRWFIGR